MTKRKIQPGPKEVTIKENAELRVSHIGIDGSTPLAIGSAKLGRIGHARTISIQTTDGEIRIVVI